MIGRTLFTAWLLGSLTLAISIRDIVRDDSSCEGRCDDAFDSSYPCQCNTACASHSDCCADYASVCQGGSGESCKGKCGAHYDPSLACQCNDKCGQYGNCCPDYGEECGGGDGGSLSDQDLVVLSEMLISDDANNVGGKIQLNLQCTTNNGNPQDCSPAPLFTSVDPSVMEMPIYVKLAALYDNYVTSPGTVEDHTEEEQMEEMALIEEMAGTAVMKTTYQFLVEKGVFTGTEEDWQRFLYDTWFGMYDRARAILGSSGFEHVFIGEIKNGVVSGFHNWFHWYMLEKAGELNYLGYWETAEFGPDMEHGGGISFTYTWNGTQKPYGSMFLATSPELEMALYTTCLMTRPDAKCHVDPGRYRCLYSDMDAPCGGECLGGEQLS
eukprot:TRINITY_DN3416_c0_g1_i6.p1 TRINITY_DN3416_c0_g1~~TRINITY_DN3416_c0_g1_i6.p1  ORF type:complete len:396 (+),score=144.88 TRINITY_DN3416_c0_g1_i6:43-1188(+)